MSNNKHFADLLKVCSILPALAIMPAMAGSGLENIAILDYSETSDLYSMNSNGVVGSFDNYDASDRFEASVIFVGKGQELSISDGAVIKDNRAQVGGAIAITGKQPAATLNIGKDVKFINNTALFDGGAVGNYGNTIVANGVLFQGNKAQLAPTENNDQIGGGAISLGATSKTTLVDVDFVANESGYNGGAIGTRLADTSAGGKNDNSAAVLKIKEADFITNKANGYIDEKGNLIAGNGGAIYNTFYADVSIEGADFKGNYAAKNGGAIYNDGAVDTNGNGADMAVIDAEFEANTAKSSGGAIYNSGKLVIVDAEFEGNKSESWGGAIYNTSANGDLYVKDSEFLNNSAVNGAAISAGTSAKSTVIEDSLFEGNIAGGQGTVGLFAKGILANVVFKNNSVTAVDGDGAGALFLGSLATVDVNNANFQGNTSASRGGAIATRVAEMSNGSKNRNDGTLDIADSVFNGNVAATNGGAIYNTFYTSANSADNAYVAKSSFVNNKAQNGGAIYNDGTLDYNSKSASLALDNVSFANNIATDKGGAIFNGDGATVILSGDNTFANNVAGKGANDIYNDGVLNIASGTTVLSGGIQGNGVLTLSEGATINIGNTTISQDTMNIDGIVKASVLSNRSYGRLIANTNDGLKIGDNAELHLSVGGVGEYDMFGGVNATFKNVTFGDSYLVEQLDNGVIKVTTKSVDNLAADTGLTTQAAGAIASLANSSSDKVQHISLALQEALNSGDVKVVESAAKKLNPEDKPVAQSIASSVQNQVLSLAAGRMAGGAAMGRAGGDIPQENGFWMHGLFNKTKQADNFHGYTRGVAFGFDTLIDGEYTLGGGLAINNSDVHSNGRGHTEIDSKTMFMYGQYKPSEWFVNAAVTYSMAEYTEQATVAGYVLTDEYDVDSYGAQVMAGYDFDTGVTTEFGVRYLHIAQEDYTKESGATVSAVDTDVLTTVAGAKYAFTIENDWAIQLKPELRAALTYDWLNDSDAAIVDMPGVATYKVAGENLNRLGAELGAGVTLDDKGLKVTLMYDLDLHKDYTSQTGMIKFRTQF